VPQFDPATWEIQVFGMVAMPRAWTWSEFNELPVVTVSGDLHCVTRWSTLDHQWTGVQPTTIAEIVGIEPGARFVMLYGEGGYSANLPIEALFGDDVVFAIRHDSEPLAAAHGGPLRAVVPGRYAWKSVKWLRGIEFLGADHPGFWEAYGYSNSADPWLEERFES
jgi:DMSO/TMAO reductase YedYZ molybdopterin-dependent catalytic subunit